MAITTFATLKTAIEKWSHRTDLTDRIPEFVSVAEDRIARLVRVRAMETQGVLVWKADVPIDADGVGGDANDITLTPDTAATSYAFGDSYTFTAEGTNTGNVTVDVSSLGAKSVKRIHGGVKEQLSASDIRDGVGYRVYYDGTDFLLCPFRSALLPSNYVAQRSLFIDSSKLKKIEYYPPDTFWFERLQYTTGHPKLYTVEGDWAITAPGADGTYHAHLDYYRRLASLSADSDTNWILTNARGLYLYAALVELFMYLSNESAALRWSLRFDQEVEEANNAADQDRFPSGKLAIRRGGNPP